MGTNFYLRKKLSSSKKQELIDYLNEDKYQKCEEILNEIKSIHIGKRSAGWKFLWNANNFEYFKPSKASLAEFLKSGQIIDEYGETYTFEEFWNEELEGFLDKGLDLKKYYDDENTKEFYRYYITDFEKEDYYKEHEIMPNKYGEFYIDGLRFTTSTEFC